MRSYVIPKVKKVGLRIKRKIDKGESAGSSVLKRSAHVACVTCKWLENNPVGIVATELLFGMIKSFAKQAMQNYSYPLKQ